MNNKIATVNAKDGGLELILTNKKSLGIFKDPCKIKFTLISYGILDNVAFGKSMKKASNFGFEEDDGAIKLFETSILE